MILTILFLFLLTAYLILLFYFNRTIGLTSTKVRVFTISGIVMLFFFLFYIGTGTITGNISKIFIQSSHKDPEEVFSILFKSLPESCTSIQQFQDQVVPKMDCCIWMELRTCPVELKKIAAVRNYANYSLAAADSAQFKNRFSQRPDWWMPERLNDSIHVMYYRFENGNEQSLLFNSDSSIVFVCDSAP